MPHLLAALAAVSQARDVPRSKPGRCERVPPATARHASAQAGGVPSSLRAGIVSMEYLNTAVNTTV